MLRISTRMLSVPLTWKMTSNGPCAASAEPARNPPCLKTGSARNSQHVLDEDEEIAAVEVWEAVACADCEGANQDDRRTPRGSGVATPFLLRFDGSATSDFCPTPRALKPSP